MFRTTLHDCDGEKFNQHWSSATQTDVERMRLSADGKLKLISFAITMLLPSTSLASFLSINGRLLN